jgi:phosphatidylserine/phosphatidylglycerophosphate/cardiolipin synthase-like enzyme
MAADARLIRRQSTTTGWPWRPGNDFLLLHDNEDFFARMLEAIDAAREYVLLEMYLVESSRIASRFIEALRAARARGARVCVIFDAFGSLHLRRSDRRRLTEAGVELRFFHPLHLRKGLRNLLRDHRKLLLTDGATAFVGGAGLTDEFTAAAANGAWREMMVQIRGPVVRDWQRAFAGTWRRIGPPLDLPAPACAPNPLGALGRLSVSEARQHSVLANGVLRRIDAAALRVWIMSAYFVPSRRFRRALRRAARRGVDVRLLLPGARTDHPWVRQAARRFYGKMLRNGVQIYEYQPRMLHAKMTLCDDWLSIGSSNLDRWSFRWNLEANQEIAAGEVADAAAALFQADLALSRAITRRSWRKRAWFDRLRESIAGTLDRVLDSWRRP